MNVSLGTPATTSRPLRARVRPDLVCVAQVHGGNVVWVVKDPVAMQYTAFGSEEFALLQLLDGTRSPLEVCREFERRFVPQRLQLSNLGAFVARMHSLGLVLADAPEQGEQLLERCRSRRRWRLALAPLSILAIRFRGVDADRLLEILEPKLRWAFRPGFLLACLCLMAFAAFLVVTHSDSIGAALPAWEALFSGDNLLRLMLAVGIAKILHELGHGVACKHFGGECHEIGAMLLVFVPCLYCNVSDAWLLQDKWKRISISAAGIFVELTLAALGAVFWRFSEPGPWNQLALVIVVLCSVNTLLLNGNPLMRYDGYYILSDLWGIPNLAQQSRTAVRSLLLRAIGLPVRDDEVRPDRRRLLAVYGVLSGAYRLLVLAGILWMVHRALSPRGLGTLSALLAVLVIGGLLAAPVVRAARWARQPSAGEPINRRRLLPALAMAGLIVAGLLRVPVPQHVRAPYVVEPKNAVPIYAVTSGRLVSSIPAGRDVEAGDVLAELDNIDLQLELTELNGRVGRLTARVAAMEARRDQDPAAARELPAVRQSLAAVRRQAELLEESRRRLILVAPHAGTVIPPPAVEPSPGDPQPPPISPLEEEQHGSFVPAGTLLCLVGDPARVQVVLLIDEDSLDRVQPGQSVTLQSDAIPWRRLSGRIERVSRQEMAARQENSASWLRLVAEDERLPEAERQPVYYEARIELDEFDARLRIGGRGAALITVRSEPLGTRLYRELRRMFGLRV